METLTHTKSFANISQRAVSAYLSLLSNFDPSPADASDMIASQAALHNFFAAMYQTLFDNPEQFGLPVVPDISIADNEENAKEKKQEVKHQLDKPKNMIAGGLDFLLYAGAKGQIQHQSLVLKGYSAAIKQAKAAHKFLQGLESVGLVISVKDDNALIHNSQFPQMMPALQALAARCAVYESAVEGKFLFAHCDFRALQNYTLKPEDLFLILAEPEYSRVQQIHQIFIDKKYKADISIITPTTWLIKYQGDRKVKSTPLFQMEYDERYTRQIRLSIKCVSSQRIVQLLSSQSQALQEDFSRRAITCGNCGWCRNNKTLGPVDMEYKGEKRTICWYIMPDIHEFNEDTVELIRQYETMHRSLVPGIL